MSIIHNQPNQTDDPLVNEVRSAIEHRATWMYFLMKEARDKGLEWDDFARRAIRNTGTIHGQRIHEGFEEPTSLEDFEKIFGVGTSRKVFEMEVIQENDQAYQLDFHYCPLVTAWQKLGVSGEEIQHLCDIAMDGDRGIAANFPQVEFELGQTIAQGYPVCQLCFKPKTQSKLSR
ncbi:MAG: L-2-amino-thiazoline-4-carboxylic acid hydrolase [Anaerolineaceae bacterium]